MIWYSKRANGLYFLSRTYSLINGGRRPVRYDGIGGINIGTMPDQYKQSAFTSRVSTKTPDGGTKTDTIQGAVGQDSLQLKSNMEGLARMGIPFEKTHMSAETFEKLNRGDTLDLTINKYSEGVNILRPTVSALFGIIGGLAGASGMGGIIGTTEENFKKVQALFDKHGYNPDALSIFGDASFYTFDIVGKDLPKTITPPPVDIIPPLGMPQGGPKPEKIKSPDPKDPAIVPSPSPVKKPDPTPGTVPPSTVTNPTLVDVPPLPTLQLRDWTSYDVHNPESYHNSFKKEDITAFNNAFPQHKNSSYRSGDGISIPFLNKTRSDTFISIVGRETVQALQTHDSTDINGEKAKFDGFIGPETFFKYQEHVADQANGAKDVKSCKEQLNELEALEKKFPELENNSRHKELKAFLHIKMEAIETRDNAIATNETAIKNVGTAIDGYNAFSNGNMEKLIAQASPQELTALVESQKNAQTGLAELKGKITEALKDPDMPNEQKQKLFGQLKQIEKLETQINPETLATKVQEREQTQLKVLDDYTTAVGINIGSDKPPSGYKGMALDLTAQALNCDSLNDVNTLKESQKKGYDSIKTTKKELTEQRDGIVGMIEQMKQANPNNPMIAELQTRVDTMDKQIDALGKLETQFNPANADGIAKELDKGFKAFVQNDMKAQADWVTSTKNEIGNIKDPAHLMPYMQSVGELDKRIEGLKVKFKDADEGTKQELQGQLDVLTGQKNDLKNAIIDKGNALVNAMPDTDSRKATFKAAFDIMSLTEQKIPDMNKKIADKEKEIEANPNDKTLVGQRNGFMAQRDVLLTQLKGDISGIADNNPHKKELTDALGKGDFGKLSSIAGTMVDETQNFSTTQGRFGELVKRANEQIDLAGKVYNTGGNMDQIKTNLKQLRDDALMLQKEIKALPPGPQKEELEKQLKTVDATLQKLNTTLISGSSFPKELKEAQDLLATVNLANGTGVKALNTANGKNVTPTEDMKTIVDANAKGKLDPNDPEQKKALDALTSASDAYDKAGNDKTDPEKTKAKEESFLDKLGEAIPDLFSKIENTFWEIAAKCLAEARSKMAATSAGSTIRDGEADSFYSASAILNDFQSNIQTFAKGGAQIEKAGTRIVQGYNRVLSKETKAKQDAINADTPTNKAIDTYIADHKVDGKEVPIKVNVDGKTLEIASSEKFQQMITPPTGDSALKGKIVNALEGEITGLRKELAYTAMQSDSQGNTLVNAYVRDYGAIKFDIPTKGKDGKEKIETVEINSSENYQKFRAQYPDLAITTSMIK